MTVWEDQFTSIDPGWFITPGTTFVSQATPVGVSGSEDGFEAAFNNPSGFARFAIFAIPATLIQAGDIVEYSIRSNSGVAPTTDRVNLVGDAGSAFDSLFVGHDTPSGLTYQQEAGTLFSVAQTTLSQGLRSSSNLFLGNNGPGGSGVDAIFYVDYIRIIGDRPDPARNWNQNSSGNWNDVNNWKVNGMTPGHLPTASDDVIIPASLEAGNDWPTLNVTGYCQSIEINGTLNISSTNFLYVYADFTNNSICSAGSGTVRFAGTNHNIYGSSNFYDIYTNTNASITFHGNQTVDHNLTIYKTLDTGDYTLSGGNTFWL